MKIIKNIQKELNLRKLDIFQAKLQFAQLNCKKNCLNIIFCLNKALPILYTGEL